MLEGERLTPEHLRMAMAALRIDGPALADAIGAQPETVWRNMRGDVRSGLLGPKLSAKVRAYFEAHGVEFSSRNGKPGVYVQRLDGKT